MYCYLRLKQCHLHVLVIKFNSVSLLIFSGNRFNQLLSASNLI